MQMLISMTGNCFLRYARQSDPDAAQIAEMTLLRPNR